MKSRCGMKKKKNKLLQLHGCLVTMFSMDHSLPSSAPLLQTVIGKAWKCILWNTAYGLLKSRIHFLLNLRCTNSWTTWQSQANEHGWWGGKIFWKGNWYGFQACTEAKANEFSRQEKITSRCLITHSVMLKKSKFCIWLLCMCNYCSLQWYDSNLELCFSHFKMFIELDFLLDANKPLMSSFT